eukprot:770669_1
MLRYCTRFPPEIRPRIWPAETRVPGRCQRRLATQDVAGGESTQDVAGGESTQDVAGGDIPIQISDDFGMDEPSVGENVSKKRGLDDFQMKEKSKKQKIIQADSSTGVRATKESMQDMSQVEQELSVTMSTPGTNAGKEKAKTSKVSSKRKKSKSRHSKATPKSAVASSGEQNPPVTPVASSVPKPMKSFDIRKKSSAKKPAVSKEVSIEEVVEEAQTRMNDITESINRIEKQMGEKVGAITGKFVQSMFEMCNGFGVGCQEQILVMNKVAFHNDELRKKVCKALQLSERLGAMQGLQAQLSQIRDSFCPNL